MTDKMVRLEFSRHETKEIFVPAEYVGILAWVISLLDWQLEAIGDDHVVGLCESCSAVVLESEEYRGDEEGCILCAKCASEAREEAKTK